MSKRKSVLLVISTEGQFTEFFVLAKYLNENTDLKPLIYFNLGFNENSLDLAKKCFSNNIDVVSYGSLKVFSLTDQESKTSSSLPKLGIKKRLTRFLKNALPQHFLKIRRFYYIYIKSELVVLPLRFFSILKRLKYERELLRLFNIKLIVLGEDNQEYYTPYLVKVGHSHSIKTIVMPYAYANRFDSLVLAHYLKNYSSKNLLNYLISKFFKKWTLLDSYNGRQRSVLKNTASIILTAEFFKVSPKNPWTMSGGDSDAVLVESQHMFDYYLEDGQLSDKMKITGFPSNDILFNYIRNKESFRETIKKKYSLHQNHKIWAVFALPSEQPRELANFSSYNQFLDTLFAELNKLEGVQLIYKLHPRTSFGTVSALVKKHGVIVVNDEGSYELIGMADIFVASVSSVMRWSLACNVPTINYDVYRYRYSDFDGSENYTVVVNTQDLIEKIKELSKSNLQLSAPMSVTSVNSKYPSIDGRSTSRVVGNMNEMLNSL